MVDEPGTQNREPTDGVTMTAKRLTPEQARLLRDLDRLVTTGKVDADRVVDYLRSKQKRGRGRPPVDPQVRQGASIAFRVTQRELDALRTIAHRQQTTVSALLRNMVRKIIHNQL